MILYFMVFIRVSSHLGIVFFCCCCFLLLQALKFPVVATFAGDSSRLLTTALKSNIQLLKVSSSQSLA